MKMMLIGEHVGHSKSPDIYKAAFDILGEGLEYEVHDVESQFDASSLLLDCEYDAVNITTPYKGIVPPRPYTIDEHAEKSGGMNLIVKDRTDKAVPVFRAYNTDGIGCISFLEKTCGLDKSAKMAICGTGYTSFAIAAAASDFGISDICMLSRHGYRGRAPFRRYAYWEENGRRAVAEADIIVDASICGMNPGDRLPFDTDLLTNRQIVLDTVYGHGTTPIAAAARRAQSTFFDGKGMLAYQASISLGKIMEHNGRHLDRRMLNEIADAMAKAIGA